MARSWIPFMLIGVACVSAGGFVSAVSALAPSYTAAWVVAYLVLVGGIAQIALGLAQSWLVDGRPAPRLIIAEAVTFNVANAVVIFGTLGGWMTVVDVGTGLFAIALALFLWAARSGARRNRWLLYGFRALIVVLIVSAVVGLVIAAVRVR